MLRTSVRIKAIRTTNKPTSPKLELLSSTATDMMNKSQDMTQHNPANAEKDAERRVEGSATFDATIAMTKTAKPIVTGKGTTLY